jgi:trimeric autotransporter adhesin
MFMLTGRKLALTLAFTVLVAAAFGAGCRGFFVKPVLTAISVGPTGQNLQQGDTLQMSARGTYDTQPPQDITGQVLWSSDNLAVATVVKGGLVTGVSAPGTANISATLQTLTGSASVTVVLTGVTKITITPQTVNVKQGATQNFTCAATVTGQPNPVDITASVAWTTSDTTNNVTISNGANPAVLTVGNTAALGPVTVTATYTVGSTVFTNTATVTVVTP